MKILLSKSIIAFTIIIIWNILTKYFFSEICYYFGWFAYGKAIFILINFLILFFFNLLYKSMKKSIISKIEQYFILNYIVFLFYTLLVGIYFSFNNVDRFCHAYEGDAKVIFYNFFFGIIFNSLFVITATFFFSKHKFFTKENSIIFLGFLIADFII